MILTLEASKDYELLDSGEGEKLERFGDFILSRPDPQALWRKKLDQSEWKKASAVFTRDENKGDWNVKKDLSSKWEIELAGLKFFIKPTPFKHVGIFPEQAANWEWMTKLINKSELKEFEGRFGASVGEREPAAASADADSVSRETFNSDLVEIEVLNLFAYTGGATLAAAKAGAKVVHVDGSKAAITWANENAELSGLKDKPIRWILEDARSFVKREIKRGRKYHGIVMDPPSFGHGPENELWKIEEDFLPLLEDCIKLLADKPLFFLINGYSAGYSAIAYDNNLEQLKN
jgi:23S rRNA (cytosine1962-C5)-methyltransferase